MATISEIKSSAFGRIFKSLAAKISLSSERIQGTAGGVWRTVGRHAVEPSAMACDAELITLALAKDEQGIVYQKFDLSGWDE